MSLDQTQNFVRATIASAVDSADTTIDVTDSNQLPDPADGEYNLILWDVSTFPRPGQDPAVEVVRATALDGSADTLSVDRGQENTAAADHPETAVLQLSPTAKMFADIDAKTSALSADGQTFDGESVVTEEVNIEGIGTVGVTQEDISNFTTHHGFEVTLSSDEWYEIFDLNDGVQIYGGVINGIVVSGLRLTFDDDSAEVIGSTSNSGDSPAGVDTGGDRFVSFPIPRVTDPVKKLEFYPQTTAEYGWRVETA